MLHYVKLTLLAVLIAAFAYAVLNVFPSKLRLLKRVGMNKTNTDLIALAKSGDPEAATLLRKSRRLMWVAIPAAVTLSVLQSLSKL